MKVLKVLASILLGFIMFVLVGVFGILTAGRIMLSGNNISNIVRDMAKESGEFNVGQINDNEVTFNSKEFQDAIAEMKKYDINVDEIYDEFGAFASQVIKYTIGATDEIDAESMKDVLKKAAQKYEEKTGEKIDLTEIDEGIDNGINEIKQDVKQARDENSEAFEIIETIFNTKTYFGILMGIFVCAVLIVLINKSVVPLCITFIITSILGIIANIGFFVITKVVPTDNDKIVDLILNSFSHIFLGIAVAFVVVLLISIVGIVFAKRQKKPVTA